MENISPENPLLRILEATLTSNDIQVPEGSVERLLNRREWIYPTQRVDALLKKLTELQLYSLFSYQHHLESAIQGLGRFYQGPGFQCCLWSQGSRKVAVSFLCFQAPAGNG